MHHTILSIDSTTNHIFSKSLKAELDFEALHQRFNPALDTELAPQEVHFHPYYFLQLREGVDSDRYYAFVSKVRQIGWNIDGGINGMAVKSSYASVIEYGAACARIMQLLEGLDKTLPREGGRMAEKVRVEVYLMANHLSYAKLLKEIKTAYPYVQRVLICDTQSADDQLMLWADEVIDIKTLRIGRVREQNPRPQAAE